MKSKLALSGISGLLLALAMPEPGVWLLAWVALVPLFVALRRATPLRGAACGLIAGFAYFGIILVWMRIFGNVPWVLLVAVEALFVALFAAAASRLMPSRIGWLGYIGVSAAWTAVQWLRSLGPYAFTWGSLAHLQANNLPVAQLGSITGPWGIDFLVCLFNLTLAELMMQPRDRRARMATAAAVLLVVAAVAGGWTGMRRGVLGIPDVGMVRVAVIQGDAVRGMQSAPGDDPAVAFSIYESLSRPLSGRAELVVWPETALPTAINRGGWADRLAQLAEATGADYVVGGYESILDRDDSDYYNAAYLFGYNGKRRGVYRKVRLVPFGEFVPLRKQMPVVRRYGVRDRDVTPGRAHTLLKTEYGGKAGVSICFESIFPQIARMQTRQGATQLLVITNDSWFGRTAAAGQHAMMARLRAIENHRYVVRAASTGISCIIDPHGRVEESAGLFERSVIRGLFLPMYVLTPYARLGDYFAYFCAAAAIALLLTARGKLPKQAA